MNLYFILPFIICANNSAPDTVTLNELLPANFVMTSGTVTVTIPLPSQGCDTVMVSGYFTAPGECMDNINTVQLITSTNDTLTADTCVMVMFPCWEPGIDIIADSTYSSTLPQVVYSNDTMYIEGVLFVDDDLWFYGCMIYTAPGAHIVVMPGANLTIDSATVIEGCDTMWQGITLRSPYSSVWMDNGSKIKDAECGIFANDTTEFYVFNSEITESISGITTKADSTGNYGNITGRVEGTKFGMWNSGTLKPAYIGQPPHGAIPRAGIELNNVAGMVIGNYSNNKNQFNRMHSGIVGWGSVYRVRNCEFTTLSNDAAYSTEYAGTAVISKGESTISKANVMFQQVGGGGNTVASCLRGAYTFFSDALITNVKMEGVTIGVYSTHTSTNKEVTVEACEITASKYGVNFYANAGARKMTAQDNTIHVSTKGSIGILAEEMTAASIVPYVIERNFVRTTNGYGGIVCNNLGSPQVHYNSVRFSHTSAAAQMYGIEINANTRPQVSCNNVMSNTVSAADSTKIGIAVKISSNSNVSCNTVDSTGYGIFFGGVCTGTSFKGNFIRHHYTGLYLNKVAVISQQPAGGAPPYHGNEWLDTTAYTSGYGAVNMNDSTSQNLLSSLITTNQNVASHNPKIPLNNALPPFYVNDQGWFDPQTLGNSFSCSGSSYCNAALAGGGDDETRLRIAQDDDLTTEFIPESKLMAKQQLYDELKKDSALLLTDSVYQVFIINNLNTSIGILQEVAERYSDLKKASSVLAANLHYTDSIIKMYADSLQMLDSLHATAALQDYESRRAHLVDQLNSYQKQLDQYYDEQKQNDTATLAAISQLNNSVAATEQPDENEKFINEMTALYYNDNKTALTTNMNQIETIAQLCPYKGGVSVFRARAIIRMFKDSAEYDDATACAAHGIYRAAETEGNDKIKEEQRIKIIPNPAANNAEIILMGINEGICTIEITDELNRTVLTGSFECKQSRHTLNVSKLSSGFYQVKVRINDESLQAFKLTIIR